jgi:hypothetical protein
MGLGSKQMDLPSVLAAPPPAVIFLSCASIPPAPTEQFFKYFLTIQLSNIVQLTGERQSFYLKFYLLP